MNALPTPDERFAGLPGYAWAPHHLDYNGLYVHHLDVALAAERELATVASRGDPQADAFLRGKLASMRYFFHQELPKVGAWLGVVRRRDATCRDMQVDWFAT